MADKTETIPQIKDLVSDYQRLSPSFQKEAAERKAEEFVLELFGLLGWEKKSEEVVPQKRIRRTASSDRVDYGLKIAGSLGYSLYIEVKKFSNNLDNPEDIEQAIGYGKNGGARWVILTNFRKIRIFNSDYYDEPKNAELFAPIDLLGNLDDSFVMDQLFLLSKESCAQNALDQYAKRQMKWKESADVEDLLTVSLLSIRKKLSKAISEHNSDLLLSEKDKETTIDLWVQLIIDRLIFSRILEDNGVDEERKLRHEHDRWEKDKRVQFYSDFVVPFFERMAVKYDSTIFRRHPIENLKIKNEDFIPIFDSFYKSDDGLRFRFDAIPADVLGHVYEHYLSFKAKKTPARVEIEPEQFKRKQGGIYYTPTFLVDSLVHDTLGRKLAKCKTTSDALGIKVIDPACGSGAFLIRAYEEFRKWYYAHEKEAAQTRLKSDEVGMEHFLDMVMENCIYGVDVDPRAVELTKLNLFIRAISNPKKLPNVHIVCANTLVADPEYEDGEQPFIFERAFPIVHEQGGFDVVITNPPWEKWKPDSQEFFEPYEPGFKSLTAQTAKARMQELLSKRPYLKKKWKEYNDRYELLSEYFRNKDYYRFQSDEADGRQVSGDLDLYKLFTEKAYQLLREGGLAGLVVPSGLYTDLGAKGLRRMLFENCEIQGLFSFENRGHAIFPDVHASYKFILLSFQKGGKTKEFPAAFFLYGKETLEAAQKSPTMVGVDFVKKSSPTSWNILEIKTPLDASIVRKMLVHPHLGDEIKDSWNIELSSGFHMTNDSHLFRPYGEGMPMLEGKNIHQFTHQWKEAPTPKSSITLDDLKKNEKTSYYENFWLGFRRIARSTDERTLICAVIPPGYCCAESLTFVKNMLDPKVLCYVCGVINSFVLDYYIRQKVSANINMFHFMELPIPRLNKGPVFDAIVRKAAQLSCTTKEFDKLKDETGIGFGIVEETDRAVVRAQIDALVAKLYGITRDELVHILSVFPIVEEKTKTLVIQEFDKLA